MYINRFVNIKQKNYYSIVDNVHKKLFDYNYAHIKCVLREKN